MPAGVEAIVVDNASADGSPELVRASYPEVRLISNSNNLGFARACNQGISSTTAPFVLLLNSDAQLLPSTLDALLSCLARDPRRAAAGCSLIDSSGRDRPSTWNFLTPLNQALEFVGLNGRAFARLSRSYRPRLDPDGVDWSGDWIEASCLMLRRAALEQVGLLDERFFMYSEDEDLCWRLKRCGWLICYSNRAQAVHRGGASAELDASQSMRHFYKSQYLLLLKQRGMLSARIYLAANEAALLLKWAWHAVFGNRERLPDIRLRYKAISQTARLSREPIATA
jgi:GT2 family glycosyltransferase